MSWGFDLTTLQDQLKKSVEEASQFVDAAQNQFNFDDLAEKEEEEEKLAEYYESLELQDIDDEQAIAESNFEDEISPDQESQRHRDRHSHRTATDTSHAPTSSGSGNGVRIPKGLVKKVQVLDVSGFDFDDESEPTPQGAGAVGVGIDKVAVVDKAISTIETVSVDGGSSSAESEAQSVSGEIESAADNNSAHRASHREVRSDGVVAAATIASSAQSIDQFDDWDDDDDFKPIGQVVTDASQVQGDVPKPSLAVVSDTDNVPSIYGEGVGPTEVPQKAKRGASQQAGAVVVVAAKSSGSNGGSSIYRSSTPPAAAPAEAVEVDEQRSRSDHHHYSAGKEKTDRSPAGSVTARNSKAMVAAQLKQQQLKRSRKKKKGGDKGVLDFFGISSSTTQPSSSAGGGSVATATGSPQSNSRDEAEGGGGGAVVTHMASVFFDPVGMLSDDVDAEAASAEAASGYDPAAGGRYQQFQQRLGTGGGFDLGLGLAAGKMFSFFDDDGGEAEESDPILQQVAYNKSNPQASQRGSGKVQMLLTAYNFSFDEGGGVVPDYEDHEASDKAKSDDDDDDEEGQREGGEGRRRRERGADALALLAQAILSSLAALWTHSKALVECLSVATQDIRGAMRGSCGSVLATAAAACSAAMSSTSDRQHSRLAGLGALGTSLNLQDAASFFVSLVNPETRQYRLRQLWEFISSPRGLAALVVLLCLYSYLKFGIDLD